MQFICEFTLENARNSVLELQKGENFLGEDPQTEDPPFLPKITMRVPINHKKLLHV
jgi:5-hydroxyisourate hydrolase-like protein (transthyretin family)